jgi:hypothetical protein
MHRTPKAGDPLNLRLADTHVLCKFVAHPDNEMANAKIAHAMTSDTSTVYHLVEAVPPGREFALKVMHRTYRQRSIAEVCSILRELRHIPGLSTCDRICVTPEIAADTLRRYPDLEYAVLMPWISGTSWFDAHMGHESTEALSPPQCALLAMLLARVVAALEQREIAHSALSPPNVIVAAARGGPQIELVGLEDIRMRSIARCERMQGAAAAYRHPASLPLDDQAGADRFGLAILVSEILTWHLPAIRAGRFSAESYFDPEELQLPDSQRYRGLLDAVRDSDRDLASLLARAWEAGSATQCPSAREWDEALERLSLTRIAYTWHRADLAPAARPFPDFNH